VYWTHITGQELLGLSHNKFNDYTQIGFRFFSVSLFPFPFFSVPGSVPYHGRWQAAVNSLHSCAHLTIMISLLTNSRDVTIVCLFEVKVGIIDARPAESDRRVTQCATFTTRRRQRDNYALVGANKSHLQATCLPVVLRLHASRRLLIPELPTRTIR